MVSQHYVNNAKFYEEMIKYRKVTENYKKELKKFKVLNDKYESLVLKGATKLPEKLKQPNKPRIPEYVGACILQIANKLSNSPNFGGYSYKEEMISDGILDCMKYAENFDPEKSKNPFAYFTQICWYAAVRRIKNEKKQKFIKGEIIKNSDILNVISDQQEDDDSTYKNDYLKFLSENIDQPSESKIDPKHKKTTKAHQKKLKELAVQQERFLEEQHEEAVQEDKEWLNMQPVGHEIVEDE